MPEFYKLVDGDPGITSTVASADTVKNLLSERISGTKVATGCIISIESANIRYAFGVDPVAGGLGHLGTSGTTVVLNSSTLISKFRYISNAAGVASTLNITPLF